MWKELGSAGFCLSLVSREFSSVPSNARKAWKAGVFSPRIMKHEFVSTLKPSTARLVDIHTGKTSLGKGVRHG